MKLFVFTDILFSALFGAFVIERTRWDNAGGNRDTTGLTQLFSRPGYSSRMERLSVLVLLPLVGTYLVQVARTLTVDHLWLRRIAYAQTIVVVGSVWKCVWSAADMPPDLPPATRRMALEWYRSEWGWTVFGMLGFATVQLMLSPPHEGLFGWGHGIGILFAHWCFRYYVDLAFPVHEEQDSLQRESEQAVAALVYPVRLSLGIALFFAQLLSGWGLDRNRQTDFILWLQYGAIFAWFVWWRARLASSTLARTLPGHRLWGARQAVAAVRARIAGDREARVGTAAGWKPEIHYRRALEPLHSTWDLIFQGIFLTIAMSLPCFALAPFIRVGPVPAFWAVTALVLAIVAFCGSEHCFIRLAAPVTAIALWISWWVSPAVAPFAAIVSCIALVGMRYRVARMRDVEPMVAAGHPGRWWLASVPRGAGRPVIQEKPVSELPWAGWQKLTESEDVPWSTLWKTMAPRNRTRVSTVLGTVAVAAFAIGPIDALLHHLLPVFPLWVATDKPVEALLAAGDLATARSRAEAAVYYARSSVWSQLVMAQCAHDDGRFADYDLAMTNVRRMMGDWLCERALALQSGRGREQALERRARALEPVGRWKDHPEAFQKLELARLIQSATPSSLGYASRKATALRALALTGEAAAEVPDDKLARSWWHARRTELVAAEGRDRADLDHPAAAWTMADTLLRAAKPAP